MPPGLLNGRGAQSRDGVRFLASHKRGSSAQVKKPWRGLARQGEVPPPGGGKEAGQRISEAIADFGDDLGCWRRALPPPAPHESDRRYGLNEKTVMAATGRNSRR